MNNKTIFCILFLILITSCARKLENNKFNSLVNEFSSYYFQSHSVTATLLGIHNYDHQIDDLSKKAINEQTIELHKYLTELNQIDSTKLTEENRIDYIILKRKIQSQIWELKNFRVWERDATFYNQIIKSSITSLIFQQEIPTDKICENILSRLKQCPIITGKAKKNLVNPSRLSIEQASEQIPSLVRLIKSEITKLANKSDVWHDSLMFYSEIVIDTLTSYNNYIKKELLPKSDTNYQIGENLYSSLLKNRHQIHWTIEEFIGRTQEEYDKCSQQIIEVAKQLYTEYISNRNIDRMSDRKIVEKVLEKIANNYKQDDLLIEFVEEIIEDAKQFIEVKALINLPEDYHLQIDRTPDWYIGQNQLELKVPGPFEQYRHYHLYILSIPKDFDWVEQIAFLKKNNKTKLQLNVIYEVMPGKLLMFSKLNDHPSKIRKIFQDESFIEGWPYQAGDIMTEAGYGGYDLRLKFMHLMTYLKVIISALIDVQYHTMQISEKDAVVAIMKDCFLERNEAEIIIEDIMLNPTKHALPFWGYIQIHNLYTESRILEGNYFSHTKFWDRLFGNGSIPIQLLSEKLQLEIRNKLEQ